MQDALFVRERRARSDAARALSAAVVASHACWEREHSPRARQRREAHQHAHEQMIEAVICNALHRHLGHPRGQVAISLGRQRRSRYAPMPYAPLGSLLEALGETGLGYLRVTKGGRPDHGWGRMTTFSAAPRLIDAAGGLSYADFGRRAGGEPIVLKQANERVAEGGPEELPDMFESIMMTGAYLGDAIDYDDGPLADRLRADMNRINAALDEAEISVMPHRPDIDTGDRWLRRIFNNGHTDFRHGGRLYGGFWIPMSEPERLRTILIDGEPVAELDFKAMAPRLLYAKAGASFPSDQDPYNIPGLPPSSRDGVKTLMASLTFSPSAFKRWPHGCAKKFGTMHRETVLKLLLRRHGAVADKLGTRVGFELQRMESDIMVSILLTGIERGMTLLPIHDAVLCRASQAREVEALMLATFKRMTGAEAAVTVALPPWSGH